jgi:serine/threonine-protein kinase
VLGRYRVGARLAAGGAGAVYLARLEGPHEFERLVAIKCIHEHLLDEPEFVTMFLDEAKLAARLNHPNIIHVYELGREKNILFMAMEYLHGISLSQLRRRATTRRTAFDHDVIAWVLARAAEGLHHAHELCDETGRALGLIHRDVSPQNVFVTYDGQVKVVDFGIARAEGRITKTTSLGKIKGKFAYMAPEQAIGHDIDQRADQFSLGVTLYESITGERLFVGRDELETLRNVVAAHVPNVSDKRADFPPALDAIMRRMLLPTPEARYRNLGEVMQELDSFIASSGRRDQRQRLSAMALDLAADDKERKEEAIADLRRHVLLPPGQSVEDETSNTAGGVPLSLPKRRGLRTGVIALLAVLLVGAGGWFVVQRLGAPPPVAEAEEANVVVIDVTTQPALAAKIVIGDQELVGPSAKATIQKSNRTLSVVVSAPGFTESRLEFVPDRDRSLLVPLLRDEKPADKAAQPSAPPAASVPEPPLATAPKPAKPAPAGGKAPAGQKPGTPAKGPLIVDNPFGK